MLIIINKFKMEHVEKARKELDKLANGMPELIAICKKYNLPADLVLGGVIGVFLLVGIIMQGYNIVCALLTCVYPMLMSVRTIENKNDEDTKNWLSFWCVYGIFSIIEMFFGFILAFIPYYSIIRIVFFVYLMAPQTNGAHTFYASVLAPYLKTHEKEIKAFIEKVQSQADEVGKEALKQAQAKAKEVATPENMMKAASMANEAQTKLDEAAAENKED